MRIRVRFAGFYRNLAGRAAIDLDLPEGATVEDALAALDEITDGRCRAAFYDGGQARTHPDLLILIDTRIVGREAVLREGNVLAFVPPMAGGSV